jgi:nitrous oxidase accessory protein
MNRSRCLWLGALGVLAAVTAPAAEWHVGAGRPLASIRAALAAAAAGDAITVHGGTYREGTLVIDKSLTLVGLDRPRLDGEHRHEVITVTASHVTIRGFEVRDAGSSNLHDFAGIKVANVSHVTIADNRLLGCGFGIYFAKSTDGAVRDNEILGAPSGGLENGNGIHAWSCERLEIAGNRVSRHRDGIYLEFVTDSRIARNRVTGCLRYGLHFMSAHRNVYQENTFLRNGAGVAVMYSREVQMVANRFGHSWGSAAYGLLLKDLTDSRITGNTFEYNSIGVTVQSSTRMVFEGNLFRANGWALQVESSSTDNRYGRNNFQGNSFDLTTNGDLVENRFEGNYWDRAEIYDLNRDGIGDVPYRPLSLFAKLVDRVPAALLLLRSPLVHFLDRAERIFPTLTPDRLFDARPVMRPHAL